VRTEEYTTLLAALADIQTAVDATSPEKNPLSGSGRWLDRPLLLTVLLLLIHPALLPTRRSMEHRTD
jgi:hypothetical protein